MKIIRKIINSKTDEFELENIKNNNKEFISNLFEESNKQNTFCGYRINLAVNDLNNSVIGILSSDIETVTMQLIFKKEELNSLINQAISNNANEEYIKCLQGLNSFPVLIQNKSVKEIDDFILELSKFILTD